MFNRKPKRSRGAGYVRKREAELLRQGYSRLPHGWLDPEATRALLRLVKLRYAATRTGAIARALLDALKG